MQHHNKIPNQDWRDAIQEDYIRTQVAWVKSWQAAITHKVGNVTFFDPKFKWPDRGTRKKYHEGY